MIRPADVGLNPTCPSIRSQISGCPDGSLSLLSRNIAGVPPDLHQISPKRASQTNNTQQDVLWIINATKDKQEVVSCRNNISSSLYRLNKQQYYLPNYIQGHNTPKSEHLGWVEERWWASWVDECICDPLERVDYSCQDYVLGHSGQYFQFWERHKSQQDFCSDFYKSTEFCYNSSELKTNKNSNLNSCQQSNVSEYHSPQSSDLLELHVDHSTTFTCDLTLGLVIHSTTTLNRQKLLPNLGLFSSTTTTRRRRSLESAWSACPATHSCSPAHITSRQHPWQPPAGQELAKNHQFSLHSSPCCHKDLQLDPVETAAKHYLITMAPKTGQLQLTNTRIAASTEKSNTFRGSQSHDEGLSSQNSKILRQQKSSNPSILPKCNSSVKSPNKSTSKYSPTVSPSYQLPTQLRSPSVNSFWLVAILLLCTRLPASQAVINTGNPDAKRLYDDLLSNYNKLVRPVQNTTDPLTVRIKLKLSQLIDVVSHYFVVHKKELLLLVSSTRKQKYGSKLIIFLSNSYFNECIITMIYCIYIVIFKQRHHRLEF